MAQSGHLTWTGQPGDPQPAHPPPFNVLVFSRTEGYRHASIPAGISALEDLAAWSAGSPAPFSVHATEETIVFNPSTLALYRVVVFLQASGEFLDNEAQLDALKGFVRAGGGVVGIHGASTGLPSSEFYRQLIGAVFTDHPEPQIGMVTVEDPSHPILSNFIPATPLAEKSISFSRDLDLDNNGVHFEWFDEWYNFHLNPRSENGTKVLMTVKESTYQGGTMGQDHPIAWCQDQGSRSFYTALGHFDEAYSDTWFMKTIWNAILWTARV